MFYMTSDITIGNYKSVKPNSVKWKCSVSNFVDTCSIKLPLAASLASPVEGTENLFANTTTVFNEGDKVDVKLGYDGENTLRFKGFINRINYATPLELECEGYSYQLKKKIFTKSYPSVTIKKILTDLTEGTDIKLSEYIPDVTLTSVTFNKAPGIKVLEWFQKEVLCVVFFDFDTLYVGSSKFALPKPTAKLSLGWNTVEDKEFKKTLEDTETTVHIVEKNPNGQVKRTKSEQQKYDNVEDVKARAGLPDKFLKTVVNELQKAKNYAGFSGDITCFLIPHVEKCYVANVQSKRYPEKEGNFFVDTVQGSFDTGGGRQKITLKFYGKSN